MGTFPLAIHHHVPNTGLVSCISSLTTQSHERQCTTQPCPNCGQHVSSSLVSLHTTPCTVCGRWYSCMEGIVIVKRLEIVKLYNSSWSPWVVGARMNVIIASYQMKTFIDSFVVMAPLADWGYTAISTCTLHFINGDLTQPQ